MDMRIHKWTGLAALMLAVLIAAVAAAAGAQAIDWERARQLRQKAQSGGTLTSDERDYLERAMAERRKTPPPAGKGAAAASRKNPNPAAPTPPREKTGLVPLSELGADQRYQNEDGGLYGAGRNEPPATHLKAALAAAREIAPLDAGGRRAPAGKIGVLAVGMSNTTQEFSRFQEIAAQDPDRAPAVVLVDGAQGGRTAAEWARPGDNLVWQTVETRLRAAGVTAQQVQVVWMKQANARPTEPFPDHARKLESDLAATVKRLKSTFPNLRLIYVSSRTYGGYATTALNPEPYAYESAFAVRWLILRQVRGEMALNHDAQRGAVAAPVLLWGPYLWADGLTPRRDGFIWKREDFRDDGTHPSVTSGRDKVARQLLAFFKSDPTAKVWFVRR